MNYERQWERLIDALDAWSTANVVAPGHIEVAIPHADPARLVSILMSPEEWDDMTGVMWGNFADAVQDVQRTLLRLQPHEAFAVYSQYRLEPSVGPALPEPRPREEASGGEWVALDREGRVVSRFADWSEPGSTTAVGEVNT